MRRSLSPSNHLCALLALVSLAASPALAQDTDATDAAVSPPEGSPAVHVEAEVPVATFDLAEAISEGTPMSADLAAERAVAASPSLEEASALGRASAAAVSRARAAMLPRLDLVARYTHVDGFPDGEISLAGDPDQLAAAQMLAARITDPAARMLWENSLENQASGTVSLAIPRDQLAFSARLTWPVSDLFFAILPALEAAESGQRARELSREATEATVRLRAREAYFELVRARGALAVAEQAERQAAAQRDSIAAAVRAGVLTDADLLGAEARVASVQQAIASARAGVQVSDAAVRVMTGASAGPVFAAADPFDVAEVADGPGVEPRIAQALDRRPELAALRASLEAQRAAGRASDASGYPHLSLYAGADLAQPNRYIIPPNHDLQPSWEVGAMLTWSPNDTLGAFHRGEELGAEAAATEARIRQLEQGVELEVRQAHAMAGAAVEQLRAAQVAEDAAAAAYESRLAQLRAGESTTAELFAAEGQLHAARLRRLDAAVGLARARARLRHASAD